MNHSLWSKKITLNNQREYQAIWVTQRQGKSYIYLLNPNDYSDLLFCELDANQNLKTIDSKEELTGVIQDMNDEINIFIR